jgi:hypothetical protein
MWNLSVGVSRASRLDGELRQLCRFDVRHEQLADAMALAVARAASILVKSVIHEGKPAAGCIALAFDGEAQETGWDQVSLKDVLEVMPEGYRNGEDCPHPRRHGYDRPR